MVKTKQIDFMRKNIDKTALCTTFFNIPPFIHDKASIVCDLNSFTLFYLAAFNPNSCHKSTNISTIRVNDYEQIIKHKI